MSMVSLCWTRRPPAKGTVPSSVDTEVDPPEFVENDAEKITEILVSNQAKNILSEIPNTTTIFRTEGQDFRVIRDAGARALAITLSKRTHVKIEEGLYVCLRCPETEEYSERRASARIGTSRR